MNIHFDKALAGQYKSSSQKARVIFERWIEKEAFCPSCGQSLAKYDNNRPVADFYCRDCKEQFELKSKKNRLGDKVVDGAYSSMIRRLESNDNPNLMLLAYDLDKSIVSNLCLVPRYFFIPDMIEKRRPLASTARRAGWTGCNINLSGIPVTGKIFYVRDEIIQPKTAILERWAKTEFLKEENQIGKGWLFDIIGCIEKLGRSEFSLSDIYEFEDSLKAKYPDNSNIRPKIRQQLQVLRDRKFLTFLGSGQYRLS